MPGTTWKNTDSRYGTAAILLHWFMLILMVAVYATINMRELYPKGTDPRDMLKALHYILGLSVLVFVGMRLAVRLTGPSPHIEPAPPIWQQSAAKVMALSLYILMIASPILGWLIVNAEAKPFPYFSALELPKLIGENKELAKTFEEWHETIGTIGYYLVGAHALAGLFHHYVKRDNALLNMLPRRT